MQRILILLTLLAGTLLHAQDKPTECKEYSYTEFLALIEQETDTIFRLSDAVIKYDTITDKGFLVPSYNEATPYENEEAERKTRINKTIELQNVQFFVFQDFSNNLQSSLHSIIFEKHVTIHQSFGISISNCVFKNGFEFANSEYNNYTTVKEEYPTFNEGVFIYQSKFSGRIFIVNSATLTEAKRDLSFYFSHNVFDETYERIFIAAWSLQGFYFRSNTFSTPSSYYIQVEEIAHAVIDNNDFINGLPQFYCIEIDELIFKDNEFIVPTLVNFIGANQFKSTTFSLDGYMDYKQRLEDENPDISFWELDKHGAFDDYNKTEKTQNLTAFQYELDQKSVFYNYFKEKHITAEANKFFIEIKELENARIAYEHRLNPTFNTFFKLQINRFLKLFSNYGTEPERAVVVSLYVILFFALIYLFFPNSWDAHGRTRIMDRYRFFLKYLNRNEGASEVYQEEKEKELMPFHEFREVLEREGKTAPKFFYATALPLYKWSVSGSRLSGWFLSKIDVLNGKWSEVPENGKTFKSVLVIGAFLIALSYDLFIKVLNAVMHSINTFTTLGFGEIPITGLPRYLAIIQGFIGWFMLTIFSVSLISQLLN